MTHGTTVHGVGTVLIIMEVSGEAITTHGTTVRGDGVGIALTTEGDGMQADGMAVTTTTTIIRDQFIIAAQGAPEVTIMVRDITAVADAI